MARLLKGFIHIIVQRVMLDSLTARILAIIGVVAAFLTIGSQLYTILGFPLSDILVITAILGLVVYLAFLFDGLRTQISKEFESINKTLREGFHLTTPAASNPRRKEEPTGAGALAGLIAGGFIGLAGGPVGVIVGAIIGGLIGNQLEYEDLKRRKIR